MAFYKSKYTGIEIDQRLTQATYDDAVLAGFEGSKEEFDAILGKLKEIADKAENSIQMESENLDTFNKNVVDAINELHRELQAKPDEQDVIDQGELEVFKDEIAAKYATREELEGDIQDANSKISTLNNNLVESINTINKNVNDSLTIVNQAIQQNAETLVAEIEQRKEADTELDSKIIQEISDRQTTDDQLSERIETLENAGYQNADQVKAEIEKLVDAAPEALDTLKEIGDALNNDPDFAATMTNELSKKVDWIDYNNTKNIVLPSNGQIFGDFGGDESNSSLLGARIYNAGLENEEKQVEVGTSKVHLNLNSLDKPTIETPDGKENLVVESDIELMPIEVNFPIRTSGGSDGPEDRIYTQNEILKWFGVTDIAALKMQIANKGIQYIKYGIMLTGNPYYYKMPVQYSAFESANQIKLVFVGLNTRDDAPSKYEIIANLDGTIIEGNSNVKLTITDLSYDDTQLRSELQQTETGVVAANSEIEKLQSGKQSIQDETLQTTNKTIVGAINELLAKIQELETKNSELESRLAALEATN